MTTIVKYIVHELHPSNIDVIVESQDLKDWLMEHTYPSDCYCLQPSLEFLIVVYLQTRHHQNYVLYCFDLNEGKDQCMILESHLKCIHEIAHKYRIAQGNAVKLKQSSTNGNQAERRLNH